MAKKRSSLRGKGVGNPGAGEEKGKGIDLLFGGAAGASAEAGEEAAEDAPGAYFAPPPPPPPTPDAVPIESLPTGSGSQDPSPAGQAVDEFGLPLAMDQPPADLELAAPETPPTSTTDDSATLDFSLPTDLDATLPAEPAEPRDTGTETISDTDLNDFSLDLDLGDDDLSDLDDGGLGELDTDDDLSGLDDTDLTPGDFEDLNDEDLSGIDTSTPDPTTPTTDPPPGSEPMPPAPIDIEPEPLPPTTTPPLDPTPPIAEPQQPTTPDFSSPGSSSDMPTIPPSDIPTIPPSAPPPPPTSSIAPPRARIDSIGGIVSEKIQVVEKDILPDDTKYSGGPASGVLTVADRAQVEENELITQKVTRYIGRERREKLDKEIESLYDKVANELSVNTKDTEFALRTLSQAQDIIFEDARQYDEALYRVAVVKTMLTRKNNLRRWSYTWGTAVFFYAIIWLVAFIAGFLLTGTIRELLNEASTAGSSDLLAVRAAWFSALAGGIGGVIGILYSLYWHVSIKQDFDRQYVMYYFVQPVMGFILGAIVYFIIGAGFLVVNFASNENTQAGEVLSSATVVAFQIVIGWIAGFRQRKVFEMIDKIVQRISPKDAEEESAGDDPSTVMPAADSLGGGRSSRRL